MSSLTDHNLSVFTNSCVTPPASFERPQLFVSSSEPKHQPRRSVISPDKEFSMSKDNQSLSVRKTYAIPRAKQAFSSEPSSDYAVLFRTLSESNSLLLKEIRNLQKDHRQALSALTYFKPTRSMNFMHENQEEYIPSSPENDHYGNDDELLTDADPAIGEEREIKGVGEVEEVEYYTDENAEVSIVDVSPEKFYSEDSESDTGDNRSFQSWVESSSPPSSQDETRALIDADPFAPSGLLAVGKMWDNFSVEEYSQGSDSEVKESEHSDKWRPRITIPEPFHMTVREAKTPRKKSRSMLQAERESLEREAAEEAETRKQFHATPIPASTFLPLYELMNAKNEQRREQVKRETKQILKSNQKPFKFWKRDEEKQQRKYIELLKRSLDLEKMQCMNKFKARPIPPHVLDPKTDELLLEQEEYRKISNRMRAEELLVSAKLPKNMEIQKKRAQEKICSNETSEKCYFHPKVSHEVPDYDKAYFRFQQELAIRKQSKLTTITKPFNLQAEVISAKRSKVPKDFTPRIPSHKSSIPKSCSAVYPIQMTQTARLRKSLTQEKLAENMQKEIMEDDEQRIKRERQKELRRSVTEKSQSSDPTLWFEEEREKKMRKFR